MIMNHAENITITEMMHFVLIDIIDTTQETFITMIMNLAENITITEMIDFAAIITEIQVITMITIQTIIITIIQTIIIITTQIKIMKTIWI